MSASLRKRLNCCVAAKWREWDGPAALPPPTALRVRGGTTIGINIGKDVLHMVGLDSRGAIVLREKVSRGRIASRLANLQPCLIGIEAGMATHLRCSRACHAWPRCEAGSADIR